jgi:hypothetical protein
MAAEIDGLRPFSRMCHHPNHGRQQQGERRR